jgi:hypothetical protein
MNRVRRRLFDSDGKDRGTVAGSCKKDNGPWHYIKWSEILWSMELNKLGYRHEYCSFPTCPIPEQFSAIFFIISLTHSKLLREISTETRVLLKLSWAQFRTQQLLVLWSTSSVNIQVRECFPYKWNCIMTNVMHKFLIYLSIYFCLTCFGLSFSPFSEAGVQFRQWFKSPGYGDKNRVRTPYPGDLSHCRNCTPASEDGPKESPKHVIN